MPSDDGFRLNDDERRSPVGPESRQPNPEDPVAWTQLRAFDRLFAYRKLLAQGHVLNSQPRSLNKHRAKQQNQALKYAHSCTAVIGKPCILADLPDTWRTTCESLTANADRIFARDR